MVKVMGLLLLVVFGVEVDDVIGILVCEVEKVGCLVLISIGDKDMVQLVMLNIMFINIMMNIIFGLEEVVNKYGVLLELIIDFLVLMGDFFDNIFGVLGVGEKIVQVLL